MGNVDKGPTIDREDVGRLLSMIGETIDAGRGSAPGTRADARANAAMAALVTLHTGMTAAEVCALDMGDMRVTRRARFGTVSVNATMPGTGQRLPRSYEAARCRVLTVHGDTVRRICSFAKLHTEGPHWPWPIVAGHVDPHPNERHSRPLVAWARPQQVRSTWRALCERTIAGGPYTFAGMRRTHAAMLLASGVPAAVVAGRLGGIDAARLAEAHPAELAEGEANRAIWAAMVADMRACGHADPEGRAVAEIVHESFAALVG